MASADSVEEHTLLAEPAAVAPGSSNVRAAARIEDLFRAHYASIWRLLRRFGVAAAHLDDAAQEVFWVAARRLADVRSGSEHAFLYGIAIRVASTTIRRDRSAHAIELDALGELVDGRPSPEDELDQHRARAFLDAVLDRMPLELRSVLVLVELEGQSVPEVAAIHDIPVGTASSRLRRAREEFAAIAKRLHAVVRGRGARL